MSELKYGECPYCGRAFTADHRCWQRSAIGSLKGQFNDQDLLRAEVERITAEVANLKEQLAAREVAITNAREQMLLFKSEHFHLTRCCFSVCSWLNQLGNDSFLHEHEAQLLEEVEEYLNKDKENLGKVVPGEISDYEERAIRRHQKMIQEFAATRRTK